MDVPLLSQLAWPIALFFITLFIRAVFAFLETSITAMRLYKLKKLAKTTPRHYEHLFQVLEKNPHYVMITTLVASSIADVTCAALATYIAETIFAHFHLSSGLGFSLGVGIASIAIIVFGEIIPKNLAKGKSETIFRSMLWLINLVYFCLYPLVRVLIRFSNAIIYKITGSRAFEKSGEWVSSEQEIQFLIGYIHGKGLMEPEKSEMLQNIFELGHTPVKEIMVPKTNIVSINVDTSIDKALKVFGKHHFTRLPVYQDKEDNVIGMVHQKDIFLMLSKDEKKSLRDILRVIMFVPETLKISQLLREFRHKHEHIAMVLNEYGSVTGLITLEDVLEEIVGEISDEHELETKKIVPLQDGGWLVDSSIPLEDLGEFLDITFETDDSITLGGFVTEKLQHVPQKGERVLYKNYYFQIQKASSKRVGQVLIFQKKTVE